MAILDILGKVWVLLALWAFYPLITSLITQWLMAPVLGVLTHQAPAFTLPDVWVVPAATPWLGLVTLLLVLTWLWESGPLSTGAPRGSVSKICA